MSLDRRGTWSAVHHPPFILAIVLILVASGCTLSDPPERRDTPELRIAQPTHGTTVASHFIDVRGEVLDPDGVATVSVSVDGAEPAPCLARAGQFICVNVELASGENVVTVTATDATGEATERRADVALDAAGAAEGFDITLRYLNPGDFTDTQQAAFDAAADMWSRIIINDLEELDRAFAQGELCGFEGREMTEPIPSHDEPIDDLLIFVGVFEQAPEGVLGLASPCLTRDRGPSSGTNVVGYMEFDSIDLEALEDQNLLVPTIAHEMGHVIGIGTNWEYGGVLDLLEYETADGGPCEFASEFTFGPEYTGLGGWAGFTRVGGSGDVPVEDSGGLGTQCGHWDNETFGNELMTGFLDPGFNPVSEVTVLSLTDIGFEVDVSQAEPFDLLTLRPSAERDRFPIGEREVVLPSRYGVDPTTGEITPLADHH